MNLEVFDKMIAFYLPLPYFGTVPVNWTIASTWIVMVVLLLVSFLATRFLSTEEQVSHWQTAMEVLVKLIYSEIGETVSQAKAMRYLPFIGTLFLFILTSNLLTVFPGFRPPTASLSTTGALALMVFVGIPFFGIRAAGIKGYLKKYLEPSAAMLPFNIFSEIASTFAMAVRLFGNMLSGGLIGSICLMLMPFIVPLPMQVLGLLTGSIQAYIFAMLAVLYIASLEAESGEAAKSEAAKNK